LAGRFHTAVVAMRMRSTSSYALTSGLCAVSLLGFLAVAPAPVTAAAPMARPATVIRLAGLQSPARLIQDRNGVTHIEAASLPDLFFLQGWVHARDRLFQMDVSRREPSGTLAELLGKAALPRDVQARTIGLRRAAERSWAAAAPDLRAVLSAYADGVNAYVADHPLPPEYGALHLTSFEPWTPVDTLTIGKAISFELSFDLDIGPTLQLGAYVAALGPQRGYALFTQDVMRSQPFSNASTIPDALSGQAAAARSGGAAPALPPRLTSADLRQLSEAARLARGYLAKIAGDPLFGQALGRDGTQGSNEWAVSGSLTVNGQPLLANDPHLSLGEPSTFYPVGLQSPGMDVEGEGFAGVPGVIIGHNRWISWGATTNPMDVTDTYLEKVVADPSSPSGLSTVFEGTREHVIAVPETFRYSANGQLITATAADGVPPATLIVPRRNNGPIVQLTPPTASSPGSALSVQYTGFSPTFELEAFLRWDRARNLTQFEQGLPFFAVGSQNWSYADVRGNIAYFTSAEMPVREDLQAGTVNGLPPWFIRNGQGGNEWLPVQHPQPYQAIPYEIYPAAEMPHIVNPPAGWFVSANNDPAGVTLGNDPLSRVRPGGGIYYLNYGYDQFRAGRIEQMLRQRLSGGRKVSMADMEAMQADTTLLDAEYFVPHITQAFADAKTSGVPQLSALAADPQVAEAVQRLGQWDFTTPTGIAQGYDAGRVPGSPPSPAQVADSVAATIYAAWRSRAVTHIIDDHLGGLPAPDDQHTLAAMKHLLDTFSATHGVGASGISFFAVPGMIDPAASRDYLILSSLRDALTLLAGPAFGPAFHESASQDHYRWGRLHRLVLAHPLGGPFSVPPAFGQFPAPLPGLAGIPVDGGFETVDAATHPVRAADANGFMFGGGPARRFVASPAPDHTAAVSALPGGTSADPASPFYLNLLQPYLSNEYYPAVLASEIAPGNVASQTLLMPGG
jgi:penicillin G amidase